MSIPPSDLLDGADSPDLDPLGGLDLGSVNWFMSYMGFGGPSAKSPSLQHAAARSTSPPLATAAPLSPLLSGSLPKQQPMSLLPPVPRIPRAQAAAAAAAPAPSVAADAAADGFDTHVVSPLPLELLASPTTAWSPPQAQDFDGPDQGSTWGLEDIPMPKLFQARHAPAASDSVAAAPAAAAEYNAPSPGFDSFVETTGE